MIAEHPGYAFFQRRALELTGVDLRHYKTEQMQRRLTTLLARARAASFVEYARVLERDQQRRQEFLDFFTINVSEFYRDPAKWQQLEERILPELLQTRPRLRVWSAGCSIGAEPYTLAMILQDRTPGAQHRILATDVDARVLQTARAGSNFSASDVRNLTARRLARYFDQDGERYQVKPELRRRPEFKQHDLLRDPFEADFDLIVCRNVVIYFTNEAKDALYRRLSGALHPRGILFVGGTEIVMNARAVGLEPVTSSFYRRARETIEN